MKIYIHKNTYIECLEQFYSQYQETRKNPNIFHKGIRKKCDVFICQNTTQHLKSSIDRYKIIMNFKKRLCCTKEEASKMHSVG